MSVLVDVPGSLVAELGSVENVTVPVAVGWVGETVQVGMSVLVGAICPGRFSFPAMGENCATGVDLGGQASWMAASICTKPAPVYSSQPANSMSNAVVSI